MISFTWIANCTMHFNYMIYSGINDLLSDLLQLPHVLNIHFIIVNKFRIYLYLYIFIIGKSLFSGCAAILHNNRLEVSFEIIFPIWI